MSHLNQRADYGSISLAGYRLKLATPVHESVTNIYGRKVSQGEIGPDDHPINSTWIQRDWTGGGQVRNGTPDTVSGRFDFGTVETMYGQSITLAPLPDEWEDPALSGSECVALGVYNNTEWCAWGADIRMYNSGTDAWDDMGTNLTGAPVKKGCVWVPKSGALAGVDIFCIPLGSSFDYVNGTTRTNVAKSAADLIVFDNKLFRLGTDGSFEYTTDLSTWSGSTYVPDGSTPRRLALYMTVGGDLVPYVVTNSRTFVWDSFSNTLLESQLYYPRHPDQGRGVAVWRSELWVSAGDGAHRYNRSTIIPAGLDRDDGLPDEYRGIIVDMEASYNAIYALVSGVEEDATETTDESLLHVGDDYMTADQPTATSLLMKWNGFGWHFVAEVTGTAPTQVFVSDARNEYAVWWAANKKMYRVPLTRTYMNLRTNETIPVRDFGFFETSWYNFGWEGQAKILKSFEMFVDEASETETVFIQYKLDDDLSDWQDLGTIDVAGEHAFFFNLLPGATIGSTDPNDYLGIACERIKYRFELRRGSDSVYNKPIIKWYTTVARKMLRPVRSFRCVCLLETVNGYPSLVQREALYGAIVSPQATEFVYQNETILVDLVALEFDSINVEESASGTKLAYVCKFNLIEANETIIDHENFHH